MLLFIFKNTVFELVVRLHWTALYSKLLIQGTTQKIPQHPSGSAKSITYKQANTLVYY